jgi:hypothetical protein
MITCPKCESLLEEVKALRTKVSQLEAELRLHEPEPTTTDEQRAYLDKLLGMTR